MDPKRGKGASEDALIGVRHSTFRLGVLAHDLLHFADVDIEELTRKFLQPKHPTILKYVQPPTERAGVQTSRAGA
jgi:hypothetical protein